MRLRTPRIYWLPILACCAFAACTQIENPGRVVPGSPSVEDTQSRCLQRVQFDDVPIPRGFEYVTRGNRSFSYEGGGVRVGRFEYWGRTALQETAAFFKETGPAGLRLAARLRGRRASGAKHHPEVPQAKPELRD